MDTIVSNRGLERLKSAQRVVLKLGSALLVNGNGEAHKERFASIAQDVHDLRRQGKQIIIVSSGAVALGRRALGYSGSALKLEEKQAAAATGQPRLIRAWEDALAQFSIPVAQALLTIDDTETRRRWLNARATLHTLVEAGAVPIVNENDTVATEEIRYGDNDRLGARVAQMVGADVLVLLSDIDGLYTADPRKDINARHIPEVTDLTADIMAMGGEANAQAGVGSGGMATKLVAARIAMTAGCATVITEGAPRAANLHTIGPIGDLYHGKRATWFLPSLTPHTARIQWLQGSLKPTAYVMIDQGAVNAVLNGKSLLHAGVVQLFGQFERGDAIEVLGPDTTPVARGVSAYSSDDSRKMMGHSSTEIEEILGYKGRPALIHKNDLILLCSGSQT